MVDKANINGLLSCQFKVDFGIVWVNNRLTAEMLGPIKQLLLEPIDFDAETGTAADPRAWGPVLRGSRRHLGCGDRRRSNEGLRLFLPA